jgi:hypothetical protein
MMQRRRIDCGIHIARRQQGGQRGSKAETAGPLRIVQRLDAEPVARQDDAPAIAFPDRECEHPIKSLDAARSPFLVGFEDDFGVALGEESIAFAREFAAQFAEIIDAAVEDDGKAEFRIDHRLGGCGGKIDDAEPAMAERHTILREGATGVRPARPHPLHHRGERNARRVAIEG